MFGLYKKNFLKIIFVALIIFTICLYQLVRHDTAQLKIAITQIVDHPSLNKIREGIIDKLQENGLIAGKSYKLIYDNAYGNNVTATLIAQKFASEQPDVIVAIATPSAQIVYRTVRSLNIPVIFSAVTDPEKAGLINNLKDNGGNITGTVDRPSSRALLQEVVQLMPNLSVLAVIYCPTEDNSCRQVMDLKISAKEFNISIVEMAVVHMADINAAARQAVSQASAIYVPNDNVIVSALDSVLQVADAAKIPVFTNNPESVKLGSVAAVANDQYEIGLETGQLVLDVLHAKSAQSVPIKIIEVNKLYMNDIKVAELGLKIPVK